MGTFTLFLAVAILHNGSHQVDWYDLDSGLTHAECQIHASAYKTNSQRLPNGIIIAQSVICQEEGSR